MMNIHDESFFLSDLTENLICQNAEHFRLGDDHAVFFVAEDEQRIAGLDAVEPAGVFGNDDLPAIADSGSAKDPFALAFAKESVSAAGNSTGETCALAALHEDDDHDGQTGENLKNSKDDGESRHVFQSFRFYTNSQLIEYNTRKSTIQVLSYDIMKAKILMWFLELWAFFCQE